MKILVPLDGSECALRALSALVAQREFWRAAPEIHLLHVHPPIPIGLVQAHVGHEALQRHYREEGEAILQPACSLLEQVGLVYNRHIHVGQAAEVIVRQAGELACDFILMGTHGRGAIGQALLGSVAHKVVHMAACPVQLVK